MQQNNCIRNSLPWLKQQHRSICSIRLTKSNNLNKEWLVNQGLEFPLYYELWRINEFVIFSKIVATGELPEFVQIKKEIAI